MTGITIPQLPDGATLDDTDLLEIVRTAADGTQSSMRVSASYFLAWLDGKDLSDAVATAPGSETAQTLASVAGVANGAATAAAAAGKAAAGAQATANGAVQQSQVGAAGGVVGLDANGGITLANPNSKILTAPAENGNFYVGSQDESNNFTGIYSRSQGNIVLSSYYKGEPGGSILFSSDNIISLGNGSYRASQYFAGTSTINTSDATEKTLASASSPFNLAQIKAALRPLQTRLYQWNDMILKKGADKARYHVGYLAQDVYALLVAANIDPTMTAMWCNDALTQEVLVTPGKEAVTTTDPETGAVTIVTPAVDPVYETQPVLNADGTQKYRQGLRMELVHAVLIDDNRDRIATLEAGYAALAAKVAALEAK